MLRLIYLVIRFIFEIPFIAIKVKHYKKHKDDYSLDERINFTRNILKKAYKRSRVNLTVTGQENLPEGAYLLTPNHQGLFDVIALFNVIETPFKIVFKKEFEHTILMGDVLEFMEYPAMDRSNLRQSMQVIKQVTQELKQGIPYVIFPEGTRSRKENGMLEFKGGSYKAAMRAKVPIVPAAFINSYKVLDRNSLKKIDVYLHIFKPIPYEEYKDLKTNDIAILVQKQIQEYIESQVK